MVSGILLTCTLQNSNEKVKENAKEEINKDPYVLHLNWVFLLVSNGINHSPPTLNGAPSPPQRFSNGPASSTSSALTNQQLPATCGARQLSKLKRFLTTLQQFGNDISPEIGEKVRTLVLALVVSIASLLTAPWICTSELRTQEFLLWYSGIGSISVAPGCRFNTCPGTVGYRIQSCHICGIGRNCSSDLIPGSCREVVHISSHS